MASEKQKITVMVLLAFAFFSYSFYLYSSLPVKNFPVDEAANKGKLVWQQYNCNACHQVYGLGGFLGPDLTNTYSIRGKDYIRAFLSSGTATMPNFHLSEPEMNAMLAWLKHINASGNADPRKFTLKTDGTIEQ